MKIEISEIMVMAAAKSDAEFDGRPWESMGRGDRERYKARALKAMNIIVPMAELALQRQIRGFLSDIVLVAAPNGETEATP